MALLEIRNLSFTYPGTAAPALRGIDLVVREGECLLLCGASGSGKSTLLRHLKRELAPHGQKGGGVFYDGEPLEQLPPRVSAGEIGFVMQNPENQIVTDKVWHELAFGLESTGCPEGAIRRRVAEMASFFGIAGWFHQDTASLSGGQKQLLNLAGVMAMQPRVLVLDEPTAQLDPVAASAFLDAVRRINRELGVTVVLTEHRLEEMFPEADRVAYLEAGRLALCDEPRQAALELSRRGEQNPVWAALPAAARIFTGVGETGPCPLTVRDGRRWLQSRFPAAQPRQTPAPPQKRPRREMPALRMKDVFFRYEKALPDVLRGASLDVFPGDILCVLGANGTGKTTALGVMAGLSRPTRGRVELFGKRLGDYTQHELYAGLLAALPQNPAALFSRDTVEEELREMPPVPGAPAPRDVAELLGLTHLLGRHPYDLSGGEQQKAAFAKVLLRAPRVILLDEPTKGLDARFKREFGGLLKSLAQKGAALVVATHDVSFAAETATRCALFFDGAVVCEDDPAAFFAGNSFYTTAANRIARRVFPDAVTCEDVMERCGDFRGA